MEHQKVTHWLHSLSFVCQLAFYWWYQCFRTLFSNPWQLTIYQWNVRKYDGDCRWTSKMVHHNTASRVHICFYRKRIIVEGSYIHDTSWVQTCEGKYCFVREQQKVEKEDYRKGHYSNCNVGGIQPCCSMYKKALFDSFAHQCLVLLIEK